MHLLPANAQHIGDRHSQQDSFGFGDPENREFVDHGGFLAVVCDGMGGMEFGDAASQTATRAFLEAYQSKSIAESIPAALERSVRTANNEVVALAHTYGLSEGMGTTLVAAVLYRSSLYYISVGDSGLFLSRGSDLVMLNRPHVFANLLDAAVARGTLSRDDADTHPERESLTSFIGAETLDEIDRNTQPLPLEEGDAILLASDGLFKTLTQAEMVDCLHGNPQSWPENLVAQTIAKQREHQDNVTVLSIATESDLLDEPFDNDPLESAPVVDPRAPTVRRPVTVFPAQVAPASITAPVPIAAPAPLATKSRLWPLLITGLILVVIAAASWWFYQRQQKNKLSASPAATGPDSRVSPPVSDTPLPIRVDPDAPVARPPASQGKGK